jgi:hypothetical protein
MTCQRVNVGGHVGIVCGVRGRKLKCKCGRPATLECDWKVPTRKSGTCDAPICERCTTRPTPGKDLCARHAAEFEGWKKQRLSAASRQAESGAR